MTDDALPRIIKTRRPTSAWWMLMVALTLAGIAWMIVARSASAFFFGGLLALAGAMILWLARTTATAHHGGPNEITMTGEGLHSDMWSVRWERVASVWIERHKRVSMLYIRPLLPSDVRFVSSTIAVRIDCRLRRGTLVVCLAEDEPETLLGDMEEAAGKSLRRSPVT